MASSSNPVEATPPWLDLPPEITAVILHKLGALAILKTAQKVCTTWRSVCLDPDMWRCINMGYAGDHWEHPKVLDKMCRHAVDRSQGQLIEINIECCGDNDLLLYISQRSPQLKRLRLVHSYGVTDKGFAEAVKSFPKLEKLHVYNTRVSAEAIEAVGQSCPNLKSFKLNGLFENHLLIECDLEAFAIAANMPALRHLQLWGNKMTNKGLQAILDGCPNLESLDLRQCIMVCLCGNLGKLCSRRIMDLKPPHDSTDEYWFNDEIF